jgi:hypothetical protein
MERFIVSIPRDGSQAGTTNSRSFAKAEKLGQQANATHSGCFLKEQLTLKPTMPRQDTRDSSKNE